MFFLLMWLAPILLTGMACYSNCCGLPLFCLVGPVPEQWKWFENSVRQQSRRWAKRHGLQIGSLGTESKQFSCQRVTYLSFWLGWLLLEQQKKVLWCWKQGPAAGWIMNYSFDWCDLSLKNWRKSPADVLLLLFYVDIHSYKLSIKFLVSYSSFLFTSSILKYSLLCFVNDTFD